MTDHDLTELLLDVNASGVFPGNGESIRGRIAVALTDLTGRPHKVVARPSGALTVVEGS